MEIIVDDNNAVRDAWAMSHGPKAVPGEWRSLRVLTPSMLPACELWIDGFGMDSNRPLQQYTLFKLVTVSVHVFV